MREKEMGSQSSCGREVEAEKENGYHAPLFSFPPAAHISQVSV